MAKETLKAVDTQLAKEFGKLIEEQERKIAPEERIRKTLWGLSALEQEDRITGETTLQELILAVEERKRELRQSIAYAKDTIQSKTADKTDSELHKVAKEEAAKAERLLGYMEATSSALMVLKLNDVDMEKPMSQIRERLKGELEI